MRYYLRLWKHPHLNHAQASEGNRHEWDETARRESFVRSLTKLYGSDFGTVAKRRVDALSGGTELPHFRLVRETLVEVFGDQLEAAEQSAYTLFDSDADL